MDIIEKLAANVINTRYEDLPEDAVEAVKKGTLDTIGCIIGGASMCTGEVDLVREWGGKEESSILVHGGKYPAMNSAWANSCMAYVLDYDGESSGPLHDLVCTIPAALAMSEARGKISGREFIAAVAAADDLAVRIKLAGRDFNGFSGVGIIMVFGAAAAAARIMGLNLDKMLNALGFAFVRGAGSHQVAADKTSALRMLAGWSAKSGIEAALLAQKGLTGVKNVLQGYHGFFNLFPKDKNVVDLNALTDGLGKRYEISRVRFKYSPACGTTLAAIQASLNIIEQNNIDPQKIKGITVESGEFNHSISGQPLTFDTGDNPEPVEGQFSQPYTVANAIIRKSTRLEHFTAKYMMDPEVIKLAKKVNPAVNKAITGISSLVEIEMQDGRKYSSLVKTEEIRNLTGIDEVKGKFKECVSFAPESFRPTNPERIIEIVDRLEEVEDMTELIRLLV